MRTMTTLINFSVDLTDDGQIATEVTYVPPEVFRKVMDKWNPEYENTVVISSMIQNILRDLLDYDYLIKRYLR